MSKQFLQNLPVEGKADIIVNMLFLIENPKQQDI